MIAAHTDSPCLKLKPKSASSKSGYLMVNVQTYGGGLWHTWFDRDLSLAGRVIVRDHDGSFSHKLVKIRRPLLRVPTLAIHLNKYIVCYFLWISFLEFFAALVKFLWFLILSQRSADHSCLLNAICLVRKNNAHMFGFMPQWHWRSHF